MIADEPGVVSARDMADDAGALLVRSGLVSSSALEEARVKVASLGGTLGEQLVITGTLSDDELTEFYRQRLLVPLVNPNTLARLPIRVVSTIPSDMAIELRAIPVSLDGENNLTVAMSDPSDSHAVDEIAFFTGTYVVRAVATQMQIAWCLAHYYGHVTALGHKLLQPSSEPTAPPEAEPVPQKVPRTKGHTGKIQAARHRKIIPGVTPEEPRPNSAVLDDPTVPPPEPPPPELPVVEAEPADGAVLTQQPRARSISGEIRIPIRRAPSIRPPMPEPLEDLDSGPVITIEAGSPDDEATDPRKVPPKRKKKAKTDPPELAARGGEIDAPTGPVVKVELEEPAIIVNDEPPTGADVSGELAAVARDRDLAAPSSTIEVDDTSVGVIIHERPKVDSEPVLLLPRRARTDEPTGKSRAAPKRDDDSDEIVVLEKPKPRPDKRTQVGIVAIPARPRAARDTSVDGDFGDEQPTNPAPYDPDDPTRIDNTTAPASGDEASDQTLAPPPAPHHYRTPPYGVRAPTRPGTSRSIRHLTADDEPPVTTVMSAVELDEAIPQRNSQVIPAHLADADRPGADSGELSSTGQHRRIDYDPVDDGWGPPGTTIPPPLLGAIPGTEPGTSSSRIPVADVEDAPLMIAPPTPPEPARGSPVTPDAPSLVRALEEATSRSVQLIHTLEKAQSRDEVIERMIRHLAETHRRAGFFSIKAGELALFSMTPKPDSSTGSTLRLDRPSTLQDVVGTRLPYRGPMHDDASRNFLNNILGASPAEILLVPVTVRERVVGVLFGEQRVLHTFDDQLALAARAAGMALERILKAKRG